MRSGAWLALLLTACATARAHPDRGGPPDLSPDTRPAGDAGADADFQSAVARFGRGDHPEARSILEGFLARHPDHPLRPSAATLLARIVLGSGDALAARQILDARAPGANDPAASFVRGVAESRLGHGPQALALLRPFAERGPPSLAGAVDEEADLLLRAALAEAMALGGDAVGALSEWDRYARLPTAREHEKVFARVRAEELAARLPAEAALAALRGSPPPLARAALGLKAAAALRARGDLEGARKLDDDARAARRSQGFDGAPPWLGPGDPTRLGLAVPLSGSLRILGEVALRATMLALGDPGRGGEVPAFQVLVRDTAAGGERAERGAAELVRQEAVVGIVGVGDRRGIDQAARDGVPYVALDDQTPGRDTTAFQVAHGPDARAAELARRALAAGARSFAVLGPDSAVGQRLREAFRKAVLAGGGQIAIEKTYAAQATGFAALVADLRRARFDAVFIPDDAQRLELVAPALAVADLVPRAPGAPRAARGPKREILLLSTAAALSRSLIKNAGKYVQGALLAPGFFPAANDPRSAAFVDRFRQIYGHDPTATDAYSYDGARLLRAAVERGARTRADLLRRLGSEPFEGVTGSVRFDADHARIDPPPIYLVDGEEIRPLP